MPKVTNGFVNNGRAKIYFESAGEGAPLVFIHAGVADHRQWNNEFKYFSDGYKVIRYDVRGYGKSEPVEEEYKHLDDLSALLEHLEVNEPVTLMGCSMGGGIAMDFALTQPARVSKLIMVASAPSGLKLDVEGPDDKFTKAEKAFEDGNLDLVAEIETQIWFDGMNRKPEEVNQEMRKLLFEMNRIALGHEAKELGKRLPNTQIESFEHLQEIKIPVLVLVGDNDIPYMQAASDYMIERIPNSRKVVIEDAAHLPNMDQPEEFRRNIQKFLDEI